jgi:hypothetical protein
VNFNSKNKNFYSQKKSITPTNPHCGEHSFYSGDKEIIKGSKPKEVTTPSHPKKPLSIFLSSGS